MRIPDKPSRNSGNRTPHDPLLKELEGFEELGMKRETFQLARRILQQPKVTAKRFQGVVSALLTNEDKLKRWRKRVEENYSRMSQRDQHRVRFWMLSFYHSTRDYQAARRFIPKRFNSPYGLVELGFAWDIWSALGDEKSMELHFEAMVAGAESADHAFTRGMLLANLGDYCLLKTRWEMAAGCYREIPVESANAHQAVLGPLLALAGNFLSECSERRQALEDFQHHHDPDLSSGLAMDVSAQNRKLGLEVRTLETGLRRLLGRKRLKSIGL
jgi:tetratricopeptide (TPR) repeat protein